MNLDRDLRQALGPLAGDPVDDAARVLAALPSMADTSPEPQPVRQWLPLATMAAGLTLGALLGAWLGSTETVVEVPVVQQAPAPGSRTDLGGAGLAGNKATQANETKVNVNVDKQDRPHDPTAGFPSMPDERLEWFEIMAFGEVEIDEPLEGRQILKPDRYLVRVGTRFQTGDSQVGVYVFANDARARIDRETSVRMEVDEAELQFGRVWLDSGGRKVTLRVKTDIAEAMIDAGSGMFTRTPSGLSVLSLGGSVAVRTPAETVRLQPRERVFVDTDLGVTSRERLEFIGTETSWMTHMIIMGTDRNELVERVTSIVDAYEVGTFRDEARDEILKLGPRCVWQLAASAERNLTRDRDYAVETARLVARIVDYPSAQYALSLLLTDDAEVRVIAFRGLSARTGTDAGTTEEFWRTRYVEDRRSAVERWAQSLR